MVGKRFETDTIYLIMAIPNSEKTLRESGIKK